MDLKGITPEDLKEIRETLIVGLAEALLIVDLKGTTPEDLKEIREALIVGLATALGGLEGTTKLVNQKKPMTLTLI